MKTMQNIPRGFSLVTAIFLLVVLGTLGTLMVTFFAAQQQSSALDVMGSRAYQASRVGYRVGRLSGGQQPCRCGGVRTVCDKLCAEFTGRYACSLQRDRDLCCGFVR